jgi:hypothetical protein
VIEASAIESWLRASLFCSLSRRFEVPAWTTLGYPRLACNGGPICKSKSGPRSDCSSSLLLHKDVRARIRIHGRGWHLSLDRVSSGWSWLLPLLQSSAWQYWIKRPCDIVIHKWLPGNVIRRIWSERIAIFCCGRSIGTWCGKGKGAPSVCSHFFHTLLCSSTSSEFAAKEQRRTCFVWRSANSSFSQERKS